MSNLKSVKNIKTMKIFIKINIIFFNQGNRYNSILYLNRFYLYEYGFYFHTSIIKSHTQLQTCLSTFKRDKQTERTNKRKNNGKNLQNLQVPSEHPKLSLE